MKKFFAHHRLFRLRLDEAHHLAHRRSVPVVISFLLSLPGLIFNQGLSSFYVVLLLCMSIVIEITDDDTGSFLLGFSCITDRFYTVLSGYI